MVAELEEKALARNSSVMVAPMKEQPPSSEQTMLGSPEEEKGRTSLWSTRACTAKSFQKL